MHNPDESAINIFFQQEAIKPVLQSGTEEEKEALRQMLHFCLETTMQLLSPFMPYLTEELYQHLQQRQGNLNQSICNSHYPKPRNVSKIMLLFIFISFFLFAFAFFLFLIRFLFSISFFFYIFSLFCFLFSISFS